MSKKTYNARNEFMDILNGEKKGKTLYESLADYFLKNIDKSKKAFKKYMAMANTFENTGRSGSSLKQLEINNKIYILKYITLPKHTLKKLMTTIRGKTLKRSLRQKTERNRNFNFALEDIIKYKRNNSIYINTMLFEIIAYNLFAEYTVKLYDYGITNSKIFIVIEKVAYDANKNNLHQIVLHNSELLNTLNESQTKAYSQFLNGIFVRIFNIIEKLNGKYSFIHCDLKMENILCKYKLSTDKSLASLREKGLIVDFETYICDFEKSLFKVGSVSFIHFPRFGLKRVFMSKIMHNHVFKLQSKTINNEKLICGTYKMTDFDKLFIICGLAYILKEKYNIDFSQHLSITKKLYDTIISYAMKLNPLFLKNKYGYIISGIIYKHC